MVPWKTSRMVIKRAPIYLMILLQGLLPEVSTNLGVKNASDRETGAVSHIAFQDGYAVVLAYLSVLRSAYEIYIISKPAGCYEAKRDPPYRCGFRIE